MTAGFPSSVLVTGGYGFIGSHLARRLLAQGTRLTVLDDSSNGRRESLPDSIPNLRVVQGSIRSSVDMRAALEGASSVAHLAAVLGTRGQSTKEDLNSVNVRGVENLLAHCEELGVTKVVFASSLAVYGNRDSQKEGRIQPISDYGRSKVAGEALCRNFVLGRPSTAIALRFANVYGQGMRNDLDGSVVASFARSVTEGKPFEIYGDGRQTRDFLHVSDAVEALILALGPGLSGFHAFDVGTGIATSVNRLAGLFSKLSESDPGIEHLPPREEVRSSMADPSAAEKALGFRARVSLDEGIPSVLDWYRRAHHP